MSPTRLLHAQALILALVVALYLAGIELSLFWRLAWFDILLHFLGGVWVAVALTWALVRFGISASFTLVVLGVLGIGIGWEVFEYVLGLPRETNYALDLKIDIAMDVVGGVVGALLARRVART